MDQECVIKDDNLFVSSGERGGKQIGQEADKHPSSVFLE